MGAPASGLGLSTLDTEKETSSSGDELSFS